LINMPFGGRRSGNLFPQLAGREVPRWAVDAGSASWAQFLLRNMRAARSELPDSALRARMEEYWATVA